MSTYPSPHINRLHQETSPYLLQHAHNPVDWYPWGPEALALSRSQEKPILLSIGYSACHWCHVMEHESFENEEIAALMNEHFVCIKVDREERPDLDEIYMQATVAMNKGQGGWPMTVFLTPNQEPFFAGTYFPPDDRYGRPGFKSVLQHLADAWETQREELVQRGEEMVTYLEQESELNARSSLGQNHIDATIEQLREEFDSTHGGFGTAPKFPPATTLSLLLRYHRRSGDPQVLHMVQKTLDGMADGGMYDHIGGGFARYSTDEAWLVPHFEKMLYDNALLTSVYLEAFQVTGSPRYKAVAEETLQFILNEFTSKEGAFFSAQDADSEGVEGKFYVWSPEEILALLPAEQAKAFCLHYDITEEGNWEGSSIPHTPVPLRDTAKKLKMEESDLERMLQEAREFLYAARAKRVAPGIDDKVITAWNGMMISAMAEGYRVLGHQKYADAACTAAAFIKTTLSDDEGRLLRTYRAGKAHLTACLEDYAYLCEGLIDLYEACGDPAHLQWAEDLGQQILRDFSSEEGDGFYNTAAYHETLIVRRKEGTDGATPAANSVAASALARLSFHGNHPPFYEHALKAVEAFGKSIGRFPRAFSKALCVVDFLLEGPVQLAWAGTLEQTMPLRREASQRYLPNRVIAHGSSSNDTHPLLRDRPAINNNATLYLCRDFVCQAPITDAGEISGALENDGAHAKTKERSTLRPRLSGAATPDGTEHYAQRHRPALEHGFAPLGSTALVTSRLGFGCYRVSDQSLSHREALSFALQSGVNLIDTSTNYGGGASEKLVGDVVHELVSREVLQREEVIVVSKIGYVQGPNLQLARARQEEGRPYPDMVHYTEDCWHCIHPDFLRDQLELSLERLQLETLDICLLHNPEYFLTAASKQPGADAAAAQATFYSRLEQAFVCMETLVAAGKVRGYGVSSNSSTAPVDVFEATSLTRMLECAQRAAVQIGAERHHFQVLQLPMNLLEADAALQPNNGPAGEQTVLEFARQSGIAVLCNRPLNAIVGSLIRLADITQNTEDSPEYLEQCFQEVSGLEESLREKMDIPFATSSGSISISRFFNWADELRSVAAGVDGMAAWNQMETQMVRPKLNQVIQLLDSHLQGTHASHWQSVREAYLQALNKLLAGLKRMAATASQRKSDRVSEAMAPHLPAALRLKPLSQKALYALLASEDVTGVLCGMRQEAYVKDALEVLQWKPDIAPAALFQATSAMDLSD